MGQAGLGWGCAGDPYRVEAPWAGTATAETNTPWVLESSGVVYYPRPGDEAALAELVAYGSGTRTKLPPDYLFQRLHPHALESQDASENLQVPEGNSGVAEAFDRLAGGSHDAWTGLIEALELEFVHRPDTSSLDLLGLELSERFRGFAWEENDYPGGAEGPNELYAGTLADALDAVTPERRANRTAVSVIIRDEATEAIWEYMLGQWREVPGEDEQKLNRHAVPAYVAMREAAAADGVELKILSGHRDPQRAKKSAAKAGNSFAVASFSSHSLGLAIDVVLPRAEDDGRFRLTTRPMSAVVDMRRSPVHKWLHLNAHRFGWYPFQHEPWHWEYNPSGFREVYFADYPDGPPRHGSDE